MDSTFSEKQEQKEHSHKSVHLHLAHSYSLYFFGLLFGLIFDFIFPLRLFSSGVSTFFGITLIIFSSILILWAQKISHPFYIDNVLEGRLFHKGPYRFTKSPTHLGLALLVIGFGFLINAFFVIIFTILAFITSKVTYLRKRELFLEKNFGEAYKEYKKSVHL
ncbi:MAG: hypothetical protein NTZ44_01310 [Candidatus Nomurabacteria bacterium]|nr:hypothetical protein [Candidatus Nomurabacteria bacterium]